MIKKNVEKFSTVKCLVIWEEKCKFATQKSRLVSNNNNDIKMIDST